jgi:hypothetical protein
MKRSVFKFKLISILSITLLAMELKAQDIQSKQWENRILIVKSNDEKSEDFQQQIKLFNTNKKGLIDRKLVLFKIINDKYHFIDYAHSNLTKSGILSDDFKSKYFTRQSEFKVILLGLDGGIKLQKTKVLSIEKLFNTIDAMPMRRSEIRRQSDN